MKILLVEDSPAQRKIYQQLLIELGHKVTTANDGIDALEVIRTLHDDWDVLVSDYNMPRMNGIELITTLIDQNIFHKIVLFSGTHRDCPDFIPLKKSMNGKPWFYFVNKDDGIEKLNSVVME